MKINEDKIFFRRKSSSPIFSQRWESCFFERYAHYVRLEPAMVVLSRSLETGTKNTSVV